MRIAKRFLAAAGTCRSFLGNRQASMAVTFGLSIVPALGFVAAAIDYSRANDARTAMQKGADAAALAAAAAARDKVGTPIGIAHATYEQNVKGIKLTGRAERLVEADGIYRYEASAYVKGTLGGVVAAQGLAVEVKASATYGNEVARPTELVFVADVTNSMNFGSSWNSMIQAVSDTLERIKGNGENSEFFVTLIPMSDRVRFGGFEPSWSSVNPQPANWRGCWEPREIPDGAFPHALDDTAPTGKNKFTPSVRGSYIPDYIGSKNTPTPGDPTCPSTAVVGPTSDIEQIRAGLRSLSPGGTGRFDDGMAWAWRMVSPNWRGHLGVPNYPSKKDDRRKVVILMTDGHTTAYDTEVGGAAAKDTSFGWNNGTRKGFENLVHLCGRMKAAGIEIYSFWTGGNTKYEPYAQACASDATHYYARTFDAPSFNAAFAKVTGGTTSKETSALRLVK